MQPRFLGWRCPAWSITAQCWQQQYEAQDEKRQTGQQGTVDLSLRGELVVYSPCYSVLLWRKTMPTKLPRIFLEIRYQEAARERIRNQTMEDIMESTPQATQREITLAD